MESLINIGLYLTYLMIGFGAIASIGFGIKKMATNTQNTKKTLYTLLGLLLIVIFSYLISSDEVLNSYKPYEVTSSTVKQVGMGLSTFYILAIGAIGSVLFVELSKVFSK